MACVSYRLLPAPRKSVTRKGARRPNPAPAPASFPFPSTAWLQPEESTWARRSQQRARDAIRGLLAGCPRLQPAHFDTYAEWSVVIAFMAAAYGYYGPEGARIVYDVMAAQMPTLDLVVIDSLTTFLGPEPSAAAVHDALARLHILAMAGRSAVLLVDHHTYPLPPAALDPAALDPAAAPAALDPDAIAAGLCAADAACQIETVYRLTRLNPAGDGDEPGAVLTALGSPLPIVLPRHPDLNRGPAQAGSTPGATPVASSEAAQ